MTVTGAAPLALTALDWVADPWSAGFMRRAFAEAILCGASCGALGCFVLVRRLSFLGESIAHTVVLGVALRSYSDSLSSSGGLVAVATPGLPGHRERRRLRRHRDRILLRPCSLPYPIVAVSGESAARRAALRSIPASADLTSAGALVAWVLIHARGKEMSS